MEKCQKNAYMNLFNQTNLQMIRTINLPILIISPLAADPGGLFAQEQWKSVSNDNGVAIYSRKVAGHEEVACGPEQKNNLKRENAL